MTAGIDPVRKIAAWAFPTGASTTPDKVYFYSWANKGRWSEADLSFEIMHSDLSESTDLDSITESVETVTPPLDSDFYMGGLPSLAAFDTSHRLVRFTGSNLAGTLETGEFQIFPENKAHMRECNGLVDAAHTVTVKHRNRLNDSITTESAVTPQATGRTPIRVKDRIFSAQLNITAAETWTQARGFDVRGTPAGR